MDKPLNRTICIHCGNNPVPHFLNWYNESLSILLTPLRRLLLKNQLTRWMKRRGAGQGLGLALVKIFGAMKIIQSQEDREKCKAPRAKVLWEEAERRGIKMEELLLFGKPFDVYIASKEEGQSQIRNPKSEIRDKSQIQNSKRKIIFSGLPRPAGDYNSALDEMDDKGFLKKLFIRHDLPVPAGAAATSFRQALKVFKRVQKPVIVKPRTGSRGRHSTTFVCSQEDLKRAVKIAKQLCHWVMVEEQLLGPVYRATVINFKLEGVLRGDPPQITGDGAQTIKGLIEQKNQQPHPGVKDIAISDQTQLFLSRQGLSLSSVLQKDRQICLSEKIGVNYGGSSSEDFDICHPDNKELFVRAAQIVGDPIVGFDFIIQDITKSWKEQKCGFIEANSLPFINLHHDPLLGTPRNVAAKVWEMVGM